MDEDQIDYQNIQNVKNIAVDNMKYTARRYDVVCLVFTGFGLYANYELYKTVNELNLGIGLLFASTLLLLVIAFMSLYVLRVESSLQADWFEQLTFHKIIEEKDLKRNVENIERDQNKNESRRGWIYLGLILCVVLTLVGFVMLNLF